jgi:hypothetical protein
MRGVTGLVQGVGYRYFAFNAARRLSLTGWVRNCADGSVEAEGARRSHKRRAVPLSAQTWPALGTGEQRGSSTNHALPRRRCQGIPRGIRILRPVARPQRDSFEKRLKAYVVWLQTPLRNAVPLGIYFTKSGPRRAYLRYL